MTEIKKVPYDFLKDDFDRYSRAKEDVEIRLEAEKEIEIQEINAKYEAKRVEETAVYEKLIDACTHEVEVEVEEPVVAEETI